MECPDCGGVLVEVSLAGIDKSYRCFKCGGVWLHAKTVNGLAQEDLDRWNQINVDPEMLKFGKNECPTDGTNLAVYTGESVPEDVVIRRCPKCKWWWFPTDALFRFKPAQIAKKNYSKLWGVVGVLASVALPLAGLVVLVGGTAIGVGMVKRQQQVVTNADVGIKNLSVVYLGDGRANVIFESEQEEVVELKVDENNWIRIQVLRTSGTVNTASLENLVEGQTYEIRVAGRAYQFQTK